MSVSSSQGCGSGSGLIQTILVGSEAGSGKFIIQIDSLSAIMIRDQNRIRDPDQDPILKF